MLSLDLVKLHCRIDSDEDDELLKSFIDSAVGFIQSQLNRTLYVDSVPDNDSNGIVINGPIRQAILMTIAHWYEHREAVFTGTITKEIELGTWRLIQPYRIMGV
ncbi:TPA: phage gp6-like head-tail connector protein [Pasteurella multocida]|nr:phage gp6-like head-tail connector protein [Pasteurella multocida]